MATFYQCVRCKDLFKDIGAISTHECRSLTQPAAERQIASDHNQVQTSEQMKSSTDDPEKDQSHPSSSQSQSTNISLPPNGSGNIVWGRPDTLLLIDLYKTWEPKIKKKKKLWQKIAEIMQIHKYSYSSEQCEGRWKTLARGLKKVFDHNSKTGNDLKTQPYENQLNFIAERPNIRPAYVVDSTQDINKADEENNDSSDSDSDTSLPAPPAPAPAKKKRSNVSEVLDVLKEHIALQNRRREENIKKQDEMHNERMTVMKGFLEVFKGMKK